VDEMNHNLNVEYDSIEKEANRQQLIISRDVCEDVPMTAKYLVKPSLCADSDSKILNCLFFETNNELATRGLDYDFQTFTGKEMYFRENNFCCCLLTVNEVHEWIKNDLLKSNSLDHMICSIIQNRLYFRKHIGKFEHIIDEDTNEMMGETILRLYSGMYQDRSICMSVGNDCVTLLSCFWLVRSIECFISNQFGVFVEEKIIYFRHMNKSQREFFMNIPLKMMFYVDMNSYQENLMIEEKWDGNGKTKI